MAGLVLGIVGIFLFPLGLGAILGLIFSLIALRRIKREGLSGFGLAVAGLCLSVLGLIIFVAFIVAVVNGFGGTERVRLPDVEAGECLTDDDPLNAWVISCDFPHESEVYAVIRDLGFESDDYPGPSALKEQGERQCGFLYEGYVGVPLEESRFASRTVVASEGDWLTGGRWAVCLVERVDGGELEVSVRDSNR